MFLWSDAHDSDEILHIADTTNRCPLLAREELTYTPDAGMETQTEGPAKVGMLGILDRAEMVPARHWVHDVHKNLPEHLILAGRPTAQANARAATDTHAVTFGSGLASEEEAKNEALVRAQRTDYFSE